MSDCKHCRSVVTIARMAGAGARINEIAEAAALTPAGVRLIIRKHGIFRAKPRQPIKVTRVASPSPTKLALREFMQAHPDACAEYPLHKIGAAVGVSKERIRQLMPDYAKRRREAIHRQRVARLLAYVDANPRALLSVRDGGMPLKEVAAALGLDTNTVRLYWKEAGLPPKSLQFSGDEDHLHKIDRWEACACCGTSFAVTRQKLANRRQGMIKYRSCSVKCGIVLSQRGEPAHFPAYVERWGETSREVAS